MNLTEDDYILLWEHNIIPSRPKFENQNFKRLKKAERAKTEYRSEFSGEEDLVQIGKRELTAGEEARSLFDGDEGVIGQSLEDIEEDLQEEYSDENDDDDCFLVDEYGDDIDSDLRGKRLNKESPGGL